MEITHDLIQKFFENKCDPNEFEAVMNYLQHHPEQAERHLGIREWNEIDLLQPPPGNSQAEALEQLKRQLFPQPERPTRSIRRRMSWIAVAASFLIALAGVIWMKTKNTAVKGIARQNVQKDRPLIASSSIVRANHTARIQTICLSDGSVVQLYAHSSVRYTDSFGISERHIWLEGEAIFTIAKNRNKPFTVFSGSLATTALGTAFGVKAPASTGGIAVKLYTGRVVVKSTRSLPGWNKNIYLSPGQQVSYDDHRLLATVSRFGTQGPRRVARKIENEEQELVFNNSSLKEVIDRLSAKYNRKIIYRAEDIAGMNFTGTVAPSDTLASFLKLLAAMNNLDIQENEPVFIVRKHSD
jgi:transmembrane sensor